MSKETTLHTARVEDLTHEAQGVARFENKTVFIDGALPGELVSFRYRRRKRNFDEADLVEIIEASSDRVEPRCDYFGVCGGCSFQHVKPEHQIIHKQKQLVDCFRQLGGIEVQEFIPPLMSGSYWGYRTKARLGAKWVRKKGRVLVGFREKRKPYIADMQHCEILPPTVSDLLPAFSELFAGMAHPDKLPQIEVAVTEDVTAFVIRHLYDLNEVEEGKLREFAQAHNVAIFSQRSGPDSICPIYPDKIILKYAIPKYEVEFEFMPSDFTQVNQTINERMVAQAIELLCLNQDDRIVELYSGLGNFSLPIAKQAARVTAFEGDKGLVARAGQNADRNGVKNVQFYACDLFDDVSSMQRHLPVDYNKVFLDPPRSGAIQVLPEVAKKQVERIVYVSCNPATLARDAGLLVKELGFKLIKAGVMDMFPQTSHVESIALFER